MSIRTPRPPPIKTSTITNPIKILQFKVHFSPIHHHMATLNSLSANFLHPPTKLTKTTKKPVSPLVPLPSSRPLSEPYPSLSSSLSAKKWVFRSVAEDRGVVVPQKGGSNDGEEPNNPPDESGEYDKFVWKAINAALVLGFGTFAITKLLTIDHDYWQGWTLYEILRYAPEHNWVAYEQALKSNPVLAKMVISGVVYSIGDWIAQCYEGKPLFEFELTRIFRSGLVGFLLHGSLSHYYYQFSEALIPYDDWWVVPAKVAFDQTLWAALWNSIYFVALGFLRFESPSAIFSELKATFWVLLTAGWKLWPFAHLITYGVVPVEQRLLWVDCVELIWVTILSTYSNEKSEARISEAESDSSTNPEKE